MKINCSFYIWDGKNTGGMKSNETINACKTLITMFGTLFTQTMLSNTIIIVLLLRVQNRWKSGNFSPRCHAMTLVLEVKQIGRCCWSGVQGSVRLGF